MNSLLLYFCPAGAAVNFEIYYLDKKKDVALGDNNVTGFGNIDMLKIQAFPDGDEDRLILKMKVSGRIIESEDISYKFDLKGSGYGDGTWSYRIEFNNGKCTGYHHGKYVMEDDYEHDILDFSGAYTNTLSIYLPLFILDDFQYFDISGETRETVYESGWNNTYTDSCPDEELRIPSPGVIFITEPNNGTSVSGNCAVKGVVNNIWTGIASVEINIAPGVTGGWKTAKTSNNWSSWEFQWDTSSVQDRKYTLSSRAFIGGEYYFNAIEVFVDNNITKHPKIAGMPEFQAGDMFEYKLTNRYECDFIYGKRNEPVPEVLTRYEIRSSDTIVVNKTGYDVYEVNYYRKEEMGGKTKGDTIYHPFIMEEKGTIWFQRTDMSIVKSESVTTSYEKIDDWEPTESIHEIITFEPPKQNYMFPISVGDSWENRYYMNITRTIEFEGKSLTYSERKLFVEYHEYLRYENLTISSGTYDILVILRKFNRTGYEQTVDDNSATKDWYRPPNFVVESYSPELGFSLTHDYHGISETSMYTESDELISYRVGNRSYYSGKPMDSNEEKTVIYIYIIPSIILIIIPLILLISVTEFGKLGIFRLFSPMLSRKREGKGNNESPLKEDVYCYILDNPGDCYGDIKRALGFSNGALAQSISTLEKEGRIESERDGRLKRFYPANTKFTEVAIELNDIQVKIYSYIKENPGTNQKKLKNVLDISQQRVSYNLKLMVEARLIKGKRMGNKIQYFVIE